jgi:hypothetical protein
MPQFSSDTSRDDDLVRSGVPRFGSAVDLILDDFLPSKPYALVDLVSASSFAS